MKQSLVTSIIREKKRKDCVYKGYNFLEYPGKAEREREREKR
jgi:hypothetical protein